MAGVILLNNKNELCIVFGRKHKKYSIPKGKMNKNESLVDTAIRECYEETGIKVDISSENQCVNGLCSYPSFVVRMDGVNYNSRPVDTNEIAQVRWVSLKDLKEIDRGKLNNGLRNIIDSKLLDKLVV